MVGPPRSEQNRILLPEQSNGGHPSAAAACAGPVSMEIMLWARSNSGSSVRTGSSSAALWSPLRLRRAMMASLNLRSALVPVSRTV